MQAAPNQYIGMIMTFASVFILFPLLRLLIWDKLYGKQCKINEHEMVSKNY